ncbi:MAG: response regulator [Alphaproteobacteria bacterium]|nr:response regulator [Alphaproteobacteria bacterium]
MNSDIRYRSALLDRVIEGMRDGLLIRDAAGQVLIANSEARRLLGPQLLAAGDTFPGACVTLTPPEREEPLSAEELPSSLALRGRSTEDRELRVAGPHLEEPVVISTSAQPLLDPSGSIEGCLVWFRDLTTQRRAERARHDAETRLTQAQKMEAMGQLAGGIAHDFNNLLTVIVGSCEVLVEELDESETFLRSVAEQIEAAAGRGAELTHRLLALSKRQTLKPTVLDVNEMVASMSSLLRRALGETIVIREELDPAIGATLADVSNFENALLNLVINARDAMPEGGTLTIRTENRLVRDRRDTEPGDYVVLAVSDTGTGMTEEVKARAFEPFFSTKASGRGSGLGLATIHGFVSQSGGFVEIESTPGQGTTIGIAMPRVYVSGAMDGVRELAPAERGRGQTILVVEDDEYVRTTFVTILEELGYRTLSAPDAAAAMELVGGGQAISLLLTDVVMPGMSGWDLAKAAAEARPGLPVLFTTGYTDNVLLRRAGLDDRIHVLAKPFKAQELAKAIEGLLGGDRSGGRDTATRHREGD